MSAALELALSAYYHMEDELQEYPERASAAGRKGTSDGASKNKSRTLIMHSAAICAMRGISGSHEGGAFPAGIGSFAAPARPSRNPSNIQFPKQSQIGCSVVKGTEKPNSRNKARSAATSRKRPKSRIPETKPDWLQRRERGRKAEFPKQTQIGCNVVIEAEKPIYRNKARYFNS